MLNKRLLLLLLLLLQLYEQRIAEVKASVPADRLLVFNVKQGWEPLCAFLGLPVPDT